MGVAKPARAALTSLHQSSFNNRHSSFKTTLPKDWRVMIGCYRAGYARVFLLVESGVIFAVAPGSLKGDFSPADTVQLSTAFPVTILRT